MAATLVSIKGYKTPEVIMERRGCAECGGSIWAWRTAMDDVSKHTLACVNCDVGPIGFVGVAECDLEGEE